MEKIGLWLFLITIVLAPWVFGWLRERERQKSIRACISADGKIEPSVLEHFRELQNAEFERNRQPFWEKIDNVDHALGCLVASLSIFGGFVMLLISIFAAEDYRTGWNFKVLIVGSIVAFLIWIAGVSVGVKIYKRGSKNGSPPKE